MWSCTELLLVGIEMLLHELSKPKNTDHWKFRRRRVSVWRAAAILGTGATYIQPKSGRLPVILAPSHYRRGPCLT